MKNNINEEIKKFNLLTKYKIDLTLSENKKILQEGLGEFLKYVLSHSDEVKNALTNSGLRNFKTESGTILRDTDEIIEALEKNLLSTKEIGTIRKSVFNSQYTSKTLKELIAIDIAKSLNKKFPNGLTRDEVISKLTEKGFTGDINIIVSKYEKIKPKINVGKNILKTELNSAINKLNSDLEIKKILTLASDEESGLRSLENYLTAAVREGKSFEAIKQELITLAKNQKGYSEAAFNKKFIDPINKTGSLTNVLWNNKTAIAFIFVAGVGLGLWKWDKAGKILCNLINNPEWFCGGSTSNNSGQGKYNDL